MKIRLGFVSNSSSSSFCIYGASISSKDYDKFENMDLSKTKLELHCYGDGDVYCIGRSWDSVGDNETGKSFKESIQKEIGEVMGGKEVECSTHEYSWYNG